MRLDTVILWNVTVIGLPFHSCILYLVHNQNVDNNIRVMKTSVDINTQNNKINSDNSCFRISDFSSW